MDMGSIPTSNAYTEIVPKPIAEVNAIAIAIAIAIATLIT